MITTIKYNITLNELMQKEHPLEFMKHKVHADLANILTVDRYVIYKLEMKSDMITFWAEIHNDALDDL